MDKSTLFNNFLQNQSTYSNSTIAKIEDDKTSSISIDENIRFDENDLERGRTRVKTSDRLRRLSIHSRDDGNGKMYTINERAKPEVVLPTLFKTVSHKIDNELENEIKLESQNNKFTSYTYHVDDVATILVKFSTSLVNGLSQFQYEANLKTFGVNVQSKPPSGLLKKLFMYFFGGFGGLLLAGGVLCIICWKPLGEPPAVSNLVLGIILLCIFLLQAIFNFFQDFSSSRVMDSIHGMIPTESIVIRDAKSINVDSKTLVPGDLVKFNPGSKIPADIRIVECSPDLAFDRSILTGESRPIPASSFSEPPKSNYLESVCIAMQGTFVLNGSGIGIVVSIGDETIFGSIAKMTSKPKKGLTPLQYEIFRFVGLTSIIIISLMVLIITLWAAWLRRDYPEWINVPTLIVDLVSVAVAFIPEGLPIALTTCLLITANEMRKNSILCKSLSVVETLGSVSVLCFDKTGTLTKNHMVVTNVSDGSDDLELESYEPSLPQHNQLLTIASLCNESNLVNNIPVGGNATDRAILNFAASNGLNFDTTKDKWIKDFEIPFNSKDKFMITVAHSIYQQNWTDMGFNTDCIDYDEELLIMVKGAPDILLENCSYIMENNSILSELTEESKERIKHIQRKWSNGGKRVIMLTSKLIPKKSIIDFNSKVETSKQIKELASSELILIGMVGIEDPPRQGVKGVINKLRNAGIKIIMITGDFELTGLSIARQCGIITSTNVDTYQDLGYYHDDSDQDDEMERGISITGPDLVKLDEAQWENLIRYNELVFTRTTPEQKLLIIKQFQKYKQVIGMTGDGINDAPSLKQADVGISIANASDIAKEAADLILMEGDNDDHLFNAIIEALKFGRLVFENLRKTVGYLLPAGTYSELWPVLLNVIFGMPQMLSSFLMIIICCCTDCIGAIILAYESNERNLLSKKPRSVTKERLVDFKLLLHSYFVVGTFYTFTSMLVAFLNLKRKGYSFHDFSLSYGSYENLPNVSEDINVSSSIYFVNLVFMQLFNLLCMRTRYLSIFQHSPMKNKRLFIVMPVAVGITFFINYIPAIQNAMGTAQVPVEYYFIAIGFGLIVFIYDESRKYIARKYPKGFVARISW
ncbi:putative Ca2+ ATPase [Scheffersomyces amazonensis]|uniref:putative Ca2+ ATPase n=1 Tax=Scheffersomyces amazonensis TaxID=1078765 RepID=UPI00315CFFEC